MKSRLFAIFAVFFSLSLLPATSGAGEKIVAGSKSDISLKLELENAIGKGLDWLAAKQKADGTWGQAEYPALSALALTAFQGDPSGSYKRKYAANISKGYEQLARNAKPDGGIYVEKMANYNTSISLMALLVANDPSYEPVMKKARNFLVGLQDNLGDDVAVNGGIGYGGTYKHSDLNNTLNALEALHYTRYLKSDVANDPEARDLNWQAVTRFISRTQNLPGPNDQKWASDDSDNKGGFVYFPGHSMAGEQKLGDGRTALRSYGSMSYAGLLSFIYAQVDKNDPRVKAVIDWLTRNYTLEENPGMQQAGVYYYYHTMAKGLSAAGIDTLTLKDGSKINWRQDLAKRLLNLQNLDGSWANQNARWMEKDPTLVTAYSTITMEILHRGL
ncbi:MAG: cycloartenol synthase [Hydrogenophilales bacterium CG_4_9_14_3_um_filter_63_34]|nr:MAG: cycloartenol synthase [Hydrogenophilales bacterium CG_4_10_14_3_um_filter_63_21]PJB02769.1 MAG: cycloartenol synthase [Hydrogenophilales bacterium CG_4_9_14_3_um_filter_63_34]